MIARFIVVDALGELDKSGEDPCQLAANCFDLSERWLVARGRRQRPHREWGPVR
jgi:hypothetical protein